MAVVNGGELVREAFRNGYAVPAINTQGGAYEIVRAILEAAAEERSPILLMAYETNTTYYGLGWLPFLAQRLSAETGSTLGVHLDHGRSVETAIAAVDAGYTSVMIDYSAQPLGENISATNQVIAYARSRGVAVEAELGELGRAAVRNASVAEAASGGEPGEGNEHLVRPGDVKQFLDACSVDMLAIGIGNAHGFYEGEPGIRLDLLREVRSLSGDTPLVLHGSTGIPDPVVRNCIEGGMAKINFGTLIRTRALQHLSGALDGGCEHGGHLWRVNQHVCAKLKEDVRPLFRLCGSAGRL